MSRHKDPDRDVLIQWLTRYVRHMEDILEKKPSCLYVTKRQKKILGLESFMGYELRVVR